MTSSPKTSSRAVLERLRPQAAKADGDADGGTTGTSWSRLRAPEVVARAQAGDENAMERLIRIYDAAVYRVCYRIIGSIGGAEDARQETFIRMIQAIEKCQSPVRFSGWLLSIATHVSLDIAKQKKHTGSTDLDSVNPARNASGRDDPLAACIRKEELDHLSDAIMELNPRARMLISLQFEEGLTPLQIGAILDVPSNQVRVELFRARQSLRRALRGHDESCDTRI